MPKAKVTIIGGGLAGSECAWQLAQRGIPVTLREMKPQQKSPAHKADTLAELVCSNSFRSDNADSAVGMLHAELRALGSVVMAAADLHRVPAGEALAVDRDLFSREVTSRLLAHPLIELVPGEVTELPAEGQVVIATGPLTSDALAKSLESLVGSRLYFYDSIAPIVSADSVDMNVAFRQSRWGKGDGDDYLNLPLTKEEYLTFVQAIRDGEKLQPHAFEEPRYFEGCLPIEVMAERGDEVLSHGPMKPVGLTDPRTGRWPHAVIQLRREDRAGTAYNMVGFQTRLTWGEQKRIFRALPGLGEVEFLRMGQIHRNTFIDSPRLLGPGLALKSDPRIRFAGQITGVEGYVESTACGLLAALAVVAEQEGLAFTPPPATCAMGALYRHVTGEAHPDDYRYQPTNVIYGLFPPLPGRVKKDQKRARYGERGRSDFAPWRAQVAGATDPAPEAVGTLPAAVAPMKEALS